MAKQVLWVGLLLIPLAGCGPEMEFASVDGVVTLDGKPIADLEVQLIPDERLGTSGPPVSAYTDKDGQYRITASKTSGAVVGKNRVCIRDATMMMPGGGTDAESGEGKPALNRTPRRPRMPLVYSDAFRSPLGEVTIRPGLQTLNFELKAKP